jgi:hypothetical protein
MKLTLTPWLLALLTLAAPAHAEFFSGNDLLERLSDGRRLMAMGYVAGVFDSSWQRVHCAPPTTSLAQATSAVEYMLHNLPAERWRPAELLVLASLQATWPCAQQQQQRKTPGLGLKPGASML